MTDTGTHVVRDILRGGLDLALRQLLGGRHGLLRDRLRRRLDALLRHLQMMSSISTIISNIAKSCLILQNY